MDTPMRFPSDPKGLPVPNRSALSRRTPLPIETNRQMVVSSRGTVVSPVSDTSSERSSAGYSPSILSRTQSQSSATSTNPSLEGDARQPSRFEQFANMQFRGDYDLPCILGDIVGCPASFSGWEFTFWVNHSISHYGSLGEAGLPSYARCIFCDAKFESNDPYGCWYQRMAHIAHHFKRGEPIENSRPDFYVINDMRKKELMSKEDHERCERGCERPRVDGLKPHDYEPPERKAKREAEVERANRISVPVSREEKRAPTTSKSKKSKPLVSVRHSRK